MTISSSNVNMILTSELISFDSLSFIKTGIFNLNSRNWPTLGGYSTKEEMCLAFITYYPKIDLGELRLHA